MGKGNAAKWVCTPDNISKLAYFIWISEGQPQGRDVEHWMEAETLLKHADSKLVAAQGKKHSKAADLHTTPIVSKRAHSEAEVVGIS